jgi:hypothetical protein
MIMSEEMLGLRVMVIKGLDAYDIILNQQNMSIEKVFKTIFVIIAVILLCVVIYSYFIA